MIALSLENSQRVEGTALLPDFRIMHFDQYQAYLDYKTTDKDTSETEILSLKELINSKSPAAKAELHWRLTLIFAVPIMALIAVPLSQSQSETRAVC